MVAEKTDRQNGRPTVRQSAADAFDGGPGTGPTRAAGALELPAPRAEIVNR